MVRRGPWSKHDQSPSIQQKESWTDLRAVVRSFRTFAPSSSLCWPMASVCMLPPTFCATLVNTAARAPPQTAG